MKRTVTLTDETGADLGRTDIIEAHTGSGKLHLAFSVYVFNSDKTKILIQRRSSEKMLWPMFWANTCCSHPFENETAEAAGMRRMKEELGVHCELRHGPSYTYRAEDPAGRGVEHEYVTTLMGTLDEKTSLKPDPKEVAEWKWISVGALLQEFRKNADAYAPWFKLGIPYVLSSDTFATLV
jgi:isopentenyl-diphosphate delta-isomerase